MMPTPFYIVDVFTEKKYAGNQLAVVLNGQNFSDQEMQQIAREFNFSETTFIMSETPTDKGYPVRIFTPRSELPFAGHPTLGTAFIIQREIISKHIKEIRLSLKAGSIPVSLKYSGDAVTHLTMTQFPPKFGASISHEQAAEVVSLDLSDIDSDLPVEEVSTGFPVFIIPVRSLSGIKKARIDIAKQNELSSSFEAKEFLLYTRETENPDTDLHVRFFAPSVGVPEDPATGSANGCLAAYLVRHQVFGASQVSFRAEQGIEIGRPSILHLNATEENGEIRVQVGGRVIMVATGELV